MSDNVLTIQERLEKKAIQKLKTDVYNDISSLMNKYHTSKVMLNISKKEGENESRELYFLLRDDISDALIEGNKEKYIDQGVSEFLDSIAEAKDAIAELEDITGN